MNVARMIYVIAKKSGSEDLISISELRNAASFKTTLDIFKLRELRAVKASGVIANQHVANLSKVLNKMRSLILYYICVCAITNTLIR